MEAQEVTQKVQIPKKVLALLDEGEAYGLQATLDAFGYHPTALVVHPVMAQEIKHRLAVGDSEKIDIGDMELIPDPIMQPGFVGFRYGDPAERSMILCKLV